MSAKDNLVTVGGEPRIDFLPPEIRQKKGARRTLRGLVLLTVAMIAVCVAAYIGVTTVAIARQLELSAAQDETQKLLQTQGEYADVRLDSQTFETAKDARLVASARDVRWKTYYDSIVATLPSDGSAYMVHWIIDGYPVGEEPPVVEDGLEAPRHVTITLSAAFPTPTAAADWMDKLRDFPGVVQTSVGETELEIDRYVANAAIHLDESAFERRYFEEPAAAEEVEE